MDDHTKEMSSTTEACICFNMRKVSRVVTQIYDEALRPIGLRSGQFHLLLTANNLGKSTIQTLANEVWLDRSALSRNIRPLIKKGLIKLTIGPDKRTRNIIVTEKGLLHLQKAKPIWEQIQKRLHALLGADAVSSLLLQINEVSGTLKGRSE